MKKKNRIGTVFIYLIFIVLCLAILYPFLCVLSVSLSSAEDIKQYGFRVIPKHLDFSAYSYLFRDSKMLWQAYGTTIFVSVVGTAIGCLVTSLYAYAISRTTFRWRSVLSLFVTFTMFFSGGMAAQYITYVKLLNLKNSIWVLILPGAFSAMNTIIMRAYYEKLPYSMIESAKIDGAGEYQIFWRMMFPLAKPALATICLTLFVAYWNAYYEAMMYTEHERLKPVAVLHTPKGEMVLDFGQEVTGYAEFTVQARAGERVLLSCAEVLDADGNFYTENYRSAKSRIEYICRGGIQTGRAHHTFYGFRYLRVDEAPEGWQAENFTAVCVYSDLQRTGWIRTSDPLLNQLYQNIVWGEKDNLLDVPTDCPQRDERLGWTGDAQVSIRAITCTFDGKRFFSKWLRDMAAEQRGDGTVSHFVPNVGLFTKDPALFCGGSAWADAAVICPWQLYQAYGDKELLREHLPMMQKWVEYVCRAAGDSCIWSTGHHYGDWLALDAGEGNYTGASRKEFIATAFYAHSAQLLAQAMDALDMDGAAYHRLFETIRAAHQNAFPDCRTQTECALALHFGLAAAPDRVAAQLAELVRSNGNRLTTGFVGTPYLLHALSENGYAQTAYDLLLQTKAPSWLFSVKMGATTVWEHWDSRKADGSFWSTDMNSFNHHAYGAVADWLYGAAGGIRPGKPGYETVLFSPIPNRRLQRFEVVVNTPHGKVCSCWKWNGPTVTYVLTTPVSAEIRLGGEQHNVAAGTYTFVRGGYDKSPYEAKDFLNVRR